MISPQNELFADLARRLYLERASTVVEVELPTERRKLFFRDGEVHLHPLEKMAEHVAAHIKEMEPGKRAVDVPELRAAVDKLVEDLGVHPGVTARAMTHQELPPQLIGPLPTVYLVLGLSTRGCDEGDLLTRLHGAGTVYRSEDDSPALHQLAGLEPDMQRALVALAQPMAVSEVLRGAGADRLAMLRGMAQLRSVGLIVREKDEGLQVVNAKILQRFLQRFEEDVEYEPVELEAEEHREKIAHLLSEMSGYNHYQILEVTTRSDEGEIMSCYSRVARLIHPCHAEALGLSEGALEALFERVTEAYLVLSDPKRRSSYNNLAGIQVEVNIASDQREEEKRQMAEQNYRRAMNYIARMDYSRAVDLLKESVRLDPRPDYYARLAQTQSKNPHWMRHAAQSYEQALELSPDDAGLHVGFAQVLEALKREEEACRHYRRALDLMPDNVPAQQGLERLGEG